MGCPDERRRIPNLLNFLTGPWQIGFVPLGRLRGIRLRATDIDRM
ncbi:hypothetical protein [Nocardia vinacea]|nr:hypothetical protein [Nocardia vinacea]